MEERIAIHERALSDIIIKENLEKELQKTREAKGVTDESIKPPITIAVDMGWNKKGSGRSYDADSGQHFCIGMLTGKVVHLVFMNKGCEKCKNKVEHPDILCARTYEEDGSSKGMESRAAVIAINSLFFDKGVIVGEIVMDDDSTTKKKLTHKSPGNTKGELPE